MRGGQFAAIELFAARGPASLGVEAGNSARGNLRVGCIFLPRERGMLFCGRDTPVCHQRCRSIACRRWLSGVGNKLGIFGDDRRLSAGRKRRRRYGNGKQSTRAAPGIWFALSSTHDVPAQSMEDMSHPHSAPPTKTRYQGQNPMRAEPWPDRTRHGLNHPISWRCDDCATAGGRAWRAAGAIRLRYCALRSALPFGHERPLNVPSSIAPPHPPCLPAAC